MNYLETKDMQVDFYRHNINTIDIENVVSVLNSPILTTGDVVDKFEKDLANYLNTNYVIGLTSCTAALHLGLIAFGVSDGDEVITSPMSFNATSNAIIQA